jgi:hypothetical protein
MHMHCCRNLTSVVNLTSIACQEPPISISRFISEEGHLILDFQLQSGQVIKRVNIERVQDQTGIHH